MFLRCKKRRKDGKVHFYWSVVENRRVANGHEGDRDLVGKAFDSGLPMGKARGTETNGAKLARF